MPRSSAWPISAGYPSWADDPGIPRTCKSAEEVKRERERETACEITGSASKVKREATQRHGRDAALQRGAESAHAHAEGGGHRPLRLRGRVRFRPIPPARRPPAASAEAVPLKVV